MCQGPRQSRKPRRSRRITAVAKLLVLICAAAVPGCASLGLNDWFVSDQSFSPTTSSTIRSQSSTAADHVGQEDARTVAADYSPLRATTTGSKDGGINERNTEPGSGPVHPSGHSFVQRRARLGRPIPLPANTETLPSDHISAEEAVADRSAGLKFDNAVWQPIPGQSSPQEQAITNESPTGSLPVAESDSSIADERSLTTDPDGTMNSHEMPVDDETSASGAAVNKEPTVLDRLRGFYIPRREETHPERVRKTTRHWTDPFGLLRDREQETDESAVGSVTPLQPETEPEVSEIATRDTVVPQGRDALLEPLITQLEQELADWEKLPSGKPADELEWLRRQTDLRLLYLIDGRSADSLRVIESLPEKEQEFWQSMMLAMESYRRGDGSVPRADQLTETREYVRTASRQLQPLSTMRIRRLNFCNRIEGFGTFSVFPTSDFNAGQPLLLYAEIENYKSTLTSDGQHRSVFAAMIEFIREGETEPIASRTIRLPEIEDLCSAERTDYFQSYELTVPSLSPGKYILRLRVRDQLSQQTATSELPFDIRPLGSGQ